MSEERTQDMTKKYDTEPTIETLLKRIDALGAQMQRNFDDLASQVASFHKETNQHLATIERKITELAKDVLTVRADQAGLEDRVTELENRPA